MIEVEEKEGMTFWDHLEDFRWTLLRSIVALFVFAIISFIFMPYLYDNVIMAPTRGGFFLYQYICIASGIFPYFPDFCSQDFHVDIININLASQFFRHISTSFWLALILTFPYLVFEIWKFISPALYDSEKKSMRWVFLFGTLMFFLGCAVGYGLVFPMSLRFLSDYELSASIKNQLSLDSYMDTFLMLVFIMGCVFQLPLVSWLLSQLGLITRDFFKKYRRHAIVVLLIAAAVITPSGDPFTLGVVFGPLYLLFELSRLFVKPGTKEDTEKGDDDDNRSDDKERLLLE